MTDYQIALCYLEEHYPKVATDNEEDICEEINRVFAYELNPIDIEGAIFDYFPEPEFEEVY